MRVLSLSLACCVGLGLAGLPLRSARADTPAWSAPLVELTDAASVLYNFDNRDARPGQVASRANDHWGFFYNRLNLQATSGALTLSLRADSAWFYTSPTPAEIAGALTREGSFDDPAARSEYYRNKASEAGIELSNRFINWTYPAKVTLSYGTPDLEVALGDTYVQFGRGLVLSLRKIDELASDTTLRGLRVGARTHLGNVKLHMTALGGSLNPLRIDEASGRYLGVQESVLPGFVAISEAGMPRAITTDFVNGNDCSGLLTCSYAPDRLAGGQLEIAFGPATLGSQASVLFRQPALSPDVTRSAERITTASESLELLNLLEHGSLYLEAATQKLSHTGESGPDIARGYGLYGTFAWLERDFSLALEGKHYRRFFPLTANVSTSRAREFSSLQYSAPPTTEEVWNDTEFGSFNTCTTGGRAKGELHLTSSFSSSLAVGRYDSYAESVSNDACSTNARKNSVWDLSAGIEARPRSRRARWLVLTGARFDDTNTPVLGADGETTVFYRELYLRYDVSEPLGHGFALELQGVHRRRRETVGGPREAWAEGQHSTGIDWGEHLSAALGLEYDTRPDVPHGYVNAMLSYRPSSALSFALFAGQRRGALRCVGGVCRIYPPFEGVRLDATIRY